MPRHVPRAMYRALIAASCLMRARYAGLAAVPASWTRTPRSGETAASRESAFWLTGAHSAVASPVCLWSRVARCSL